MNGRRVLAGLGPLGLLFGCAPSAPPATRGRSEPSTATPLAAETTGTSAGVTTSTEPAIESAAAAESPSPAAAAGPTTTAYVVTVPTNPPTTTIVRPRPLPTTTLPENDDEALSDAEWWEAQSGYVAPARETLLACIRRYEQGAAGYATDTGNGFYGAYQFDLSTWRSVGGSGNPAHASPAEQDARAWALYERRGLQPWPTPDARCAR